MAEVHLNKKTIARIDRAVECYKDSIQDYANLNARVIDHFTNNDKFKRLIHSSKFRTKDPAHLKDKLIRMAQEAKRQGKRFDISQDNIFAKIVDLAGVRFLHIHTKQIELIHPLILEILSKFSYRQVDEAVAYTWDIENKAIFESVGFKTHFRESMYTSVHYVVMPHYADVRCEIQVRTLMEELWGEVSHAINYPRETESIECREQLRALARIASGSTRLVDSIFISHREHEGRKAH